MPLQRIEEGTYLPVIWLEITVGEMSEDLKKTIFHSTFSANVAHLILKYGTLLILMVTISLIALTILKLSKMRTDFSSGNGVASGSGKPEPTPAELEHLNKPDITHC